MSDSKKYEEAIKQITEAASRYYHLLIPRLCSSSVETVRAFNYSLLEAKVNTLEQLSGMTLDDILAKFAAGWTLRPDYRFDVSLLKRRLEDLDRMECSGIDLEGIGSGYPDKLRPVYNLKIDFDEKIIERSDDMEDMEE